MASIAPISSPTNSNAQSSAGNGLPSSFNTLLFSYWADHASLSERVTFLGYNFGEPFELQANFSLGWLAAVIKDALGNSILFAQWGFPGGVTHNSAGFSHVAISVDTVGQKAQCYVNGTVCPTQSLSWGQSAPMVNPTPSNAMSIQLNFTSACYADFFLEAGAAFFDLSVPANLAKFITSSGFPVDLGTNGSLPTGSAPQYFLHVNPVGGHGVDFFANNGTAGAVSPGTMTSFGICTIWPALPPPAAAPPQISIST